MRRNTTILARAVLPCLAILLLASAAQAENRPEVVVPTHHDKYSKLVAQLEGGQTEINYTEFRESFLDSEAFKTARRQSTDLMNLRKEMRELISKSKHAEVIDTAKKMASIDYTDMEAHKALQQAYKNLGDVPNNKKYHDIEFGLLNSIVKKGDGKTPLTAWPVIQVEEEYFILRMLGARVLGQSLSTAGKLCDKMEVQIGEEKKVYYFEVSKAFESYKK